MFSVAVCDDDELLCEKIEATRKGVSDQQGLVRCESYYSGEKLLCGHAPGRDLRSDLS